MDVIMGGLSEALPALLTDIGFLTPVDPLMNTKINTPTEALATLFTFVWLFFSVDSLMALEV